MGRKVNEGTKERNPGYFYMRSYFMCSYGDYMDLSFQRSFVPFAPFLDLQKHPCGSGSQCRTSEMPHVATPPMPNLFRRRPLWAIHT